MPDVSSFRRKKTTVFKLIKNPGEGERFKFTVSGLRIELTEGEEYALLENVIDAMRNAIKIEHQYKSEITNSDTGEVRQTDIKDFKPVYKVIEQGGWIWPEGHSPWNRHDLTFEEMEEWADSATLKDLEYAVRLNEDRQAYNIENKVPDRSLPEVMKVLLVLLEKRKKNPDKEPVEIGDSEGKVPAEEDGDAKEDEKTEDAKSEGGPPKPKAKKKGSSK